MPSPKRPAVVAREKPQQAPATKAKPPKKATTPTSKKAHARKPVKKGKKSGNPFNNRASMIRYIRTTFQAIADEFSQMKAMIQDELTFLSKLAPDTAVIEARVSCISALKTVTTAQSSQMLRLSEKLDALADLKGDSKGASTTIVFQLGDNRKIPIWKGITPPED